ncbi:hypothetical protein DFH09DRAFT_1131290 [Mycena vulgaris]|nr:hypothetical protein DFH09DRAFT_1131290 [Mycena vulgaris]
MGQEIELTVTIEYGGAKARIASSDEAVPVIREDLNVLGIPHPKRASIAVVFTGTVRFFWIAMPRSAIHKKLLNTVRPTSEPELAAHRGLLDRLSIKKMSLREAPAPVDATVPKAPTWKPTYDPRYQPNVGLYAMPMAGASGFSSSETMVPGRSQYPPAGVMQYADENASLHHGDVSNVPRTSDSFGSGSQSRYRDQPQDLRLEKYHRQRHDADDEMQIDVPRRSSTSSSLRINRNRYATIPDPSPHPAHTPEVHALQLELRELRQQLNADIDKERAILETLRDLDAEDSVPSAGPDSDFVMRARIEQLEGELQVERAKRRRLEGIVEDVRRECRAPFVVPALLDAFVEISRLTNETLEDG